MSGASKTESIYSCSSRSFESNSVSKPSSAWSAAAFANSSSTLLYKCIGYDPFCHRNREHLYPSYLSIVFAVYRAVGLGFLCMPHAFQQVGAVVGLALCVFAGLTFGYSYTLLCRFRYKICQIHKVPTTVPHYSYQNLIEYSLALGPRVISSFSKFFKFLFVAMNLSLNFGVSCLYTKFVSTAFQELFVRMDFPMKSIDSCLVYMTVYLALLLVPSVKNLEPLKVLGKITFTAVLLCYFYSHMYATDIQIDHQSLFRGDWREVFHFFGILLFSFVPVFQLLKIEDELIKPEDFVRGPSFSLLHITMVIITNMYISVGLWGYLTFDCIPKIGYSVLTVIPASRLLDFVKICFVTCIVSSHQELCLESVALLWSSSITKAVEKVTDRFSFSEMSWLVAGTKIVFTFSSFLAAVLFVVPDGGVPAAPAMAALGYAGNGWNVLVYPYAIELCLTYAQHGTWARPHVIAKDALAVVLGLAVSAVGVYATVTRTSPGDGDVDGT